MLPACGFLFLFSSISTYSSCLWPQCEGGSRKARATELGPVARDDHAKVGRGRQGLPSIVTVVVLRSSSLA